MSYAVCVTFKIKPEFWHEFLPIIYANAKNSLEIEEGCISFDVCTNQDAPEEVFLYEIYATEYDFQLHLKSEHFLLFDAKVVHMIAEKEIKTYGTVV